MADKEETNPFYYKKGYQFIPKTILDLNQVFQLSPRETQCLLIFIALRIMELTLIYIYYTTSTSAFHIIRLIDYGAMLISIIVFLTTLNKNITVKQRTIVLCIFFYFVFFCLDIASFCVYFAIDIDNKMILFSLIINEVWLMVVSFLMFKMFYKFIKQNKNKKKIGYEQLNYENSGRFRKKI